NGTISGTVKRTGGEPVKGVFVGARNAKTKITVKVLTDKQGRYRVQDLPAGEYEVRATATGYKDGIRSSVKIVDSTDLEVKTTNETVNFDLQVGVVRW